MTHVLSGRLEFDVQGEKRVVGPGEVAHLPPNVPHGAVALEDSVTLEIFSPPREDFLSGQKADYMK
jgi:quercetin dioxygenase-like cupin family protein